MDKGLIYALAFSGDSTDGGGSGGTTPELINRQLTFDSEYISSSNSVGRIYSTGLGMVSLMLGVQLAKNVPAGTTIITPYPEIPEWKEKFEKTFSVIDALFACAGVGIAEDGTMFIPRVSNTSLHLYFPVAVKATRRTTDGIDVPNRLYTWFTM